jgi:hypothetical protein
MKKIYRQLLLFTSAVVFMALAPLVVFYAMGYRVGIDAQSELSVGVLLVESTPRRATVTIDGRELGTTPRSVPNLKPGEVTVMLTKEGYEPWQKQLAIEPTEVTDLRNVRLFPTERTPRILAENAETFAVSPDRQLVAAVAEGQLHVFDTEGESVMPPVPALTPPEQLLWSPDSSNILILRKGNISLLDIAAQSQPAAIPALRGSREAVWDPRIPGRILAITPAGNLVAYQSATRAITPLMADVSTFAASARNIFVVPEEHNRIEILNLQGQHARTLPLEEKVERLMVTPSGTIALWNEAGNLSVMVSAEEKYAVADSALRAGFSPDGQLLYVQTDESSLHVFNISDQRSRHLPLGRLNLVVRLSSPIRDPQWFAGGHHLIYQVKDEIVISEIDIRDHPISYSVDSTNLGESLPTVGQEGASVLYLKQTQAGKQLVTTPLTLE